MRNTAFLLLLAVVLVLGAGLGWYWWTDWRFLQSTDDAYVQSDITVISPKVEGYVKEVRVGDNQEVAEGSVLFVIDDRDFAATVKSAEADLARWQQDHKRYSALVTTDFASRQRFEQAETDARKGEAAVA